MGACDRKREGLYLTYPELAVSGVNRIFQWLDDGERALDPPDGILRTIPGGAILGAGPEKFLSNAQYFSGERPPLEAKGSAHRSGELHKGSSHIGWGEKRKVLITFCALAYHELRALVA